MFKHLVSFLQFLSRANTRYNLIAQDPEKRDRSVRLAVDSIVFSIVGVVMVGLSALGFSALWKHLTSIELGGTYEYPISTLIGLIAVSACAVYSFLQTSIYSLALLIYQFRLNKRAARWWALVIWILAIAGMIGSVVAVLAIH